MKTSLCVLMFAFLLPAEASSVLSFKGGWTVAGPVGEVAYDTVRPEGQLVFTQVGTIRRTWLSKPAAPMSLRTAKRIAKEMGFPEAALVTQKLGKRHTVFHARHKQVAVWLSSRGGLLHVTSTGEEDPLTGLDVKQERVP